MEIDCSSNNIQYINNQSFEEIITKALKIPYKIVGEK